MNGFPSTGRALYVPFSDLRRASPFTWRTAQAFLALFAVCVVLALLDPRLINGITVWAKPAKFYLSLSLHLATVTAALLLLPEKVMRGWQTVAACGVIVAMSVFETLYISFRAARAEASHFNPTPLGDLFYTMMGVGAVLIMVATAVVGLQVLRHGPGTLLSRAVGWSFIFSAVLTIWVGLTLGGMGSHRIGGDMTDATGLPLFGWSTTGGDLRVSHFFSLHIVQIAPFIALFGNRNLMWAAMAGVIGVAVATYFQALAGIPFIPLA